MPESIVLKPGNIQIPDTTQFFPDGEKDPLDRLGMFSLGGFSCPVKYLSFFSDEKVTEYLSKRFPNKFFNLLPDKKKMEAAREVIEKMCELRCRPMLLTYIDVLMASPLLRDENSEYKIYDALVQSWLRREKIKQPDISSENLLDACIILATHMQTKSLRRISEDELNHLIHAISKVRPVTEIELKGRSLLNRNSEGDFRFSHYSIQEFLVSKLLLERPVYKPKGSIHLTDFIFRMISISGKVPRFVKQLDFKGLNLRNADLEGIKLPGADLSGMDLRGVNFKGADIRNADISEVNIEGADFSGALLGGIRSFQYENDLGMKFVFIPPGEFMMGSPPSESGRRNNETLHRVTLTKEFFMQTTPVTQGQWKTVMGNNPSHFKDDGENCPVEKVSWEDVQEFVKKLNEQEGRDLYRLPTEAEWEHACRAGSNTRFCFGDDESRLSEYAWYEKNSENKTHPVGQKKPNGWGLYDMHGNVWEWCSDWYDEYPSGDLTNPTGPETGSDRVIRGGSWLNDARYCRSASRHYDHPANRNDGVGFRLSREAP